MSDTPARRWLRAFVGVIAVILGVLFVAPAGFLFSSRLFIYTVGISPAWIPLALGALAIVGMIVIYMGIRQLRGCGALIVVALVTLAVLFVLAVNSGTSAILSKPLR